MVRKAVKASKPQRRCQIGRFLPHHITHRSHKTAYVPQQQLLREMLNESLHVHNYALPTIRHDQHHYVIRHLPTYL